MLDLLPYLAKAAREARLHAGLTYAHVAVLVDKRSSKPGVSESTVARFEHAQHWPENPDAFVRAYAQALDVDPRELWEHAITQWHKARPHLMSPATSTRRRMDGQHRSASGNAERRRADERA